MKNELRFWALLAALAGVGAMASGCANIANNQRDPKYAEAPDHFGQAFREDLAAQIADPDPAWKNTPPPPPSGLITTVAIQRYNTDKVKVPVGTSTQSTVGSGGSGGGGTP